MKTIKIVSAVALIGGLLGATSYADVTSPGDLKLDYDKTSASVSSAKSDEASKNAVSDDATLTNGELRKMQIELTKRGYNVDADGVMDPQTMQAIRDFQSSNKMSSTGYLDNETREALMSN